MSVHRADGRTYDDHGRLMIHTHDDVAGREEIFLFGDDHEDGSTRLLFISSDPVIKLESKLNGVFDGAQILVDDMVVKCDAGLILSNASNFVVHDTQRT